ncbi:MAG: hypothetical protein EHM18_11465, partial [Acidobacteria bacterium]
MGKHHSRCILDRPGRGKDSRSSRLLHKPMWLFFLTLTLHLSDGLSVFGQPTSSSALRRAPETNVGRYVGAVNGRAFILEERGTGMEVAPLQTSTPVFKAFGLSPDSRRILYSPLKNGAPSGELYLEDLASQSLLRLPVRVVLEAAWSPTNENQIAFTFGGVDGFGLALLELDSGKVTVLAPANVVAELLQWDVSGRGVHFFEATNDLSAPRLASRFVAVGSADSPQAQSLDTPLTFPVLERPRIPARPTDSEGASVMMQAPDQTALPGEESHAFRLRSPDGMHEILGENVAGNGRLFAGVRAQSPKYIGDGQVLRILHQGAIIRRFLPRGTALEYVGWEGTTFELATAVVGYNVPLSNSILVQGGQGYAAPGNCSIVSHVNAMAYAYDFWNSTVGAHILAAADGLVVYTNSSVTCNNLDTDCADYSSGGCPGTFLGNVVILQHSDGTYTKYAHMQLNSVQVVPGTTVCQGLYIGRQGHTGSTSGSFNGCGDHLHFQRQSSPDIFGQSVTVDFNDVASNPLSCSTGYVSGSSETSHTISPSSATFAIQGGAGSV